MTVLQEVNYFISGGNKYYNFDEFKNNKDGKLFVIGLSGSGKSTLGQEAARKTKASYIKLDSIDRGYRSAYAKRLKKDIWSKEVNSLTKEKMNEFFNHLLTLKGKYVVEGIHILYHDFDFFKDKPVIILETSVLLSSIRAYNRNFKQYHDKGATRLQILNDLYRNQEEFIDKLKKFENFMEGKNE